MGRRSCNEERWLGVEDRNLRYTCRLRRHRHAAGHLEVLLGLLGFSRIWCVVLFHVGALSCLVLLVFFGLLLHDILAELLLESSALETFQVLIVDRPQCPSNGPIPRDFTEACGGAEDMSYAVHPCRLTSLIVRVNDGNEVIYFLQRKAMVGGC